MAKLFCAVRGACSFADAAAATAVPIRLGLELFDDRTEHAVRVLRPGAVTRVRGVRVYGRRNH
jgi:hypothetical protein